MKSPIRELRHALAAVSILLIPILPANSQVNLVSNGTFADNAVGWTLSNGAFYSVGLVVLDATSPSISTDPTASQVITGLVAGQVYAVSGIYGADKDRGGGLPTDVSFGVAMDGVYLFQSMTPSIAGFHDFDFLYTASSSTALLSLSGQMNGNGQSYAIDNVMIVVPEPSSLTLLFCGGLVSAYLFTRKAK